MKKQYTQPAFNRIEGYLERAPIKFKTRIRLTEFASAAGLLVIAAHGGFVSSAKVIIFESPEGQCFLSMLRPDGWTFSRVL